MLQRLIEERNITNDATITAYTHAEDRLRKLHSHPDYWKRSELGMKKLFEKCEYSDSTKMQMLNVLIMVRRMELRPVASLDGMRNKLRKEIEAETKKNLPLLDLPDYDSYFGELCPSDPPHPDLRIKKFGYDDGVREVQTWGSATQLQPELHDHSEQRRAHGDPRL